MGACLDPAPFVLDHDDVGEHALGRHDALARLDLLENLADQVQRSIASGARLVTGGQRLPRDGYFYAPTLLAAVLPGMAAFDEETFGPVAALIEADDADDGEDVVVPGTNPYFGTSRLQRLAPVHTQP